MIVLYCFSFRVWRYSKPSIARLVYGLKYPRMMCSDEWTQFWGNWNHQNLNSCFLCRCANVLLTNPIWVIVTRMQVEFSFSCNRIGLNLTAPLFFSFNILYFQLCFWGNSELSRHIITVCSIELLSGMCLPDSSTGYEKVPSKHWECKVFEICCGAEHWIGYKLKSCFISFNHRSRSTWHSNFLNPFYSASQNRRNVAHFLVL